MMLNVLKTRNAHLWKMHSVAKITNASAKQVTLMILSEIFAKLPAVMKQGVQMIRIVTKDIHVATKSVYVGEDTNTVTRPANVKKVII